MSALFRCRQYLLGLILLSAGLAAGTASAAESTAAEPSPTWKIPVVKLPDPLTHPCIAATPEEVERLQAALKKGSGDVYWTVMDPIKRAQKDAATPPVFPPRGGQHNQWYQCEPCQMALATVDETHHQCPKCKKVYSGSPYDDVLFAKKHSGNMETMLRCAWAWTLIGDTACADFAAQVLLGYAERYEKYPYHDNQQKTGKTGGHIGEQTLGEASLMALYIAPGYDLMYNRLSAEDRKKIETGLILPMLKNMDKHQAGKSNWQTWHNAAMLAGGAVMGDETWVKKAILQRGHGFDTQMGISVTGDGMWYENSWGYHFYTLSAMVRIVEIARRLGIDLWSHPKLKKMFTLPAQYVMADGTLPRFADDVTSNARGNDAQLEPAYAVYRDPALQAVLSNKPNYFATFYGREIPATATPDIGPPANPVVSAVFRDAGHAILRTAGPSGLTAALTFGPYGGFHGHFDKLSFVLFGFGEELGVDPGRAKSQAYRLPIHTHWYKNTIAHNAVVIDGQPQQGVAGKLELFAANESFVAVRAACDTAYDKIAQTRLLVMTPEYLLVYDTNTPADEKTPHRYSWLYHGKGKTAECAAASKALPDGALLEKTAGAEYIQRLKTGAPEKPDQAVTARIVGDNLTTHLIFDAQPDTTVYTGDGPFTTVDDRVPLVILERPRGAFAAVLEPVKNGGQPTVKKVQVTLLGGNTAPATVAQIRIERETSVDLVSLSLDNKSFVLTRDNKKVLEYPAP